MSEQTEHTRVNRNSPHLSTATVREMVDALDDAESEARRDIMTRLAWRPAWAIRSRQHSLEPFLALFKKTRD